MSLCVLIADRNTYLLSGYREFLTREGWEVITASTAAECMEELGHRSPDVVVLDIDLPWDLNAGLSFWSWLLRDSVPVLLLTPANEPDVVNLMSFPVWGCYVKPLSPASLAEVLRDLPFRTGSS